MSEIEKNWLTHYRWTGDETALPVKAEALKAASEYTIELEQQNARLTQMISEEPRTKTALPDEFQRLWQACLTLAEKAEFKACFRYLEKLEKQLAERDGLIREYMTESLPYSQRAIEIQQQLEREGGK